MHAWIVERELERLRQEERPAQVPLELPLHEPYGEPDTAEASPDPAVERGVVVIEL